MPIGMRHSPIVRKKQAYATDPSTIPRSRFAVAFGPCWECVNTANTTPKIGNVEINPLTCGPSTFATVVSTITNVVAMTILAGRSHLGGAVTVTATRRCDTILATSAIASARIINAGSNCQDTLLSTKVVTRKAVTA